MEAAQQAPGAELPKQGSSSRGCLRVAATLLLLLVLVAVLGAFVAYWVYVSPVKSSEPYRLALELVQKDAKVREQLGEPIDHVFWPPPSGVNLDGGAGRATLNFEVAGPKGRAAVQAEARTIDGQWGLSLVLVTIGKTGDRIMVDAQQTSGLEDAPKWPPGG